MNKIILKILYSLPIAFFDKVFLFCYNNLKVTVKRVNLFGTDGRFDFGGVENPATRERISFRNRFGFTVQSAPLPLR